MLSALQKNWRIYLIEAWALGMFMVSASTFGILLEHPALPFHDAIGSQFGRQFLGGLAMGLTAVGLIYSPWGKRSGAHLNPAVTLANLQMERMDWRNAAWYIVFQFAGGFLGVKIFDWLLPDFIRHPAVNYVVTKPGAAGIWAAFWLEALLAFTLFTTVLIVSNHQRLAKFTGFFAGAWVMFFITFESPYSGMSINPARTVASALPAGV
ncbi:MAG: aquaporin, partial [Bacteroidota bacterium]